MTNCLARRSARGWYNQSIRVLLHAGQVNAEAWAIHLARLADHDLLDPVDDDPQAAEPFRFTAELNNST